MVDIFSDDTEITVRALSGRGYTLKQITKITGVSTKRVREILGRVEAEVKAKIKRASRKSRDRELFPEESE